MAKWHEAILLDVWVRVFPQATGIIQCNSYCEGYVVRYECEVWPHTGERPQFASSYKTFDAAKRRCVALARRMET